MIVPSEMPFYAAIGYPFFAISFPDLELMDRISQILRMSNLNRCADTRLGNDKLFVKPL